MASILGEFASAGFVCANKNSNFCVSMAGEFGFTDSSFAYNSFRPWEMLTFITVGLITGIFPVVISYFLLLKWRSRTRSTKPFRIVDVCAVLTLSALVFCGITYAVDRQSTLKIYLFQHRKNR